jgi:outer membrane receptor protein involved in Fe transport
MNVRLKVQSRMIELLLAATLTAANPLPAFAAETHRFEVPATDAQTAIRTFASQAEVQILVSGENVSEKSLHAVSGNFSTEHGLNLLLADSGLKPAYVGERSIALVATDSVNTTGNPAPGLQAPADKGKKSFWDRFRIAQTDDATSSHQLQSTAAAEEPLDEIVVTAQKKEERLLDAPQSVSVLSSQDLGRMGATQFRDFANSVPGLSFSTAGAGNTQITLRGVTTGGDVSPAVGIYVDEVPYGPTSVFNLGPQFALDAALFDLDRIEVLRGPQGTLYGASTMGGLIKYVNRRPQMQSFASTVQAGIAATEDGGVGYNVAATVNAPIVSDKAALRVSGFDFHDGGYIDNLDRGRKDVNRSDVYGARADLLLTPTDALSVRLQGFLQNISRDGEGTADYTFVGAKPFGRLGQSRPFNEPFDQRFRLGSATITYDMEGASLTGISSYQTMHSDFLIDLSAGFADAFGVSGVGLPGVSTTDKFTQEVRLASAENARPIEWVLGGFYTHEKSGLDEQFALLDADGNPVPGPSPFTYSAPSRYEEYAAFGDITWHLSDKLDVTGGLRYARNHQQESQGGSLPHPELRSSDDVITYLANARYHFTDHATGYLRYATGYRPGGPNIVTVPGDPPTFDADRLKSYEVGLKSEFSDRRFGIDLAVYDIDWSDIQISIVRGGFQTIGNASSPATIRGAELAFTARPSRALAFTGNLTYQDAHMSQADPGLQARDGERLPNVARLTANLNADYSFSGERFQPILGATIRRVGSRNTSFDASTGYPQYHLPAYTTVDLRAGFLLGAVNTQLYLRNALDEHGQLSILFPQFGGRVAILQPRTVGLTMTMSF